MTFRIERYQSEPIMVLAHDPGFDLITESDQVVRAQLEALDSATQPIAFVLDMRGVEVSVDGLIQAASAMRTSAGRRLMAHPRLVASVFVSDNRTLQFAVKGLNSAAFDYIVAPVFETFEEAIEYVRQRLMKFSG